MQHRSCLRCGAEITACMGFVLARDIVSAMDKVISWRSVREHCGRCAMWISFQPDEGVAYFTSIPMIPEPVAEAAE